MPPRLTLREQRIADEVARQMRQATPPPEAADPPDRLTLDSIKQMSHDQINENWDEVQNVLRGRQ